jgi:hypothetical protein
VTTGVCANAPLLKVAKKRSSVSIYAESRRSDVSDLVDMAFLPKARTYLKHLLQLPEIE